MSRHAESCDSLARVATEVLASLRLNLHGRVVLTEAATGAYASTAALAAAAGAQVFALSKNSAWGTASDAESQVRALSEKLGAPERIQFVSKFSAKVLGSADVVTNAGHLRPLDTTLISQLKPTAVIPTMYEQFELRATDIDLAACRARNIRVGATNERHPAVKILDYLAPALLQALRDAGRQVARQRVLVVTDNLLGDYCFEGLKTAGADVEKAKPERIPSGAWDIVVFATLPEVSGGKRLRFRGTRAPTYCQVWGDVDRISTSGMWIPREEPAPGVMGIPLTVVGAVPIVKLQAAGLKCAEVMLQGTESDWREIVQWVVGPTFEKQVA